MTEIIVISGSILAIAGLGVTIWSIIDTRKRVRHANDTNYNQIKTNI